MRRIILMMCSLIALSWLSTIAYAEEAKSSNQDSELETMQKIESLEKLSEDLNQLQLMTESIARKKSSACLMAFGNKKFCKCLGDNLPIVVELTGYINIVTTPKAELGYSKASKEDKEIIDNTLKAREACVAKSSTP